MNNQLRAYTDHTNDNQNPKVNYPDFYLIPFVSAAIGFLMVQLGTERPWPIWDGDPKVRTSIFSSILCTATALVIIAIFNRVLDRQLPWKGRFLTRLGAQYILCVTIPNLTVAGWQYLFFVKMGVPMRMEGYMNENFPAVNWMLIIWNLLYIGCYYYSVSTHGLPANGKTLPINGADRPIATGSEAVVDDVKGTAADRHKPSNLYTPHDITYWRANVAIFVSENKKTTAYLLDGRRKVYAEPTRFFGELLGNEQFYMVRSGRLLNREATATVIDRGRYYQVLLHPPHETLKITTVMDGKTAFKAWWDGPIVKE